MSSLYILDRATEEFMATASKTTSAKTKKEQISEDNVKKLEEINLALQKQNKDLQNQLNDVMNKMDSILQNKETKVSTQDQNTYIEINPLKPIRIVSLSNGGVSLRTSSDGRGRSFTIDKFGGAITVNYQDLQNIIVTDRSFIEQGLIYICDEEVIHNNYLDEYYKNFLTVDTISNILSFDEDKIVNMVSNTTESIQETIISLLVKKINRNEYVDMNKIAAVGQACKNQCDIMQLAIQMRNANNS